MLDQETENLIKSLYKFMKGRLKFNTKPKIKFIFSKSNADNHLGKTGYYDPNNNLVCVYCYDRHPKDILRSFAHEMYHHYQNCNGEFDRDEATTEGDPNYIAHNDYLMGIEGASFKEANLILRLWEVEQNMNKDQNVLDEKKKKKNKLSKAKLKKAKKMATSMEKKQGYSAEKAHKIAYAAVQKEGQDMDKKEQPTNTEQTVEVNEALKDSLVYVKDDRACNDMYNKREEAMFQDLLKKFGIKK